MSQVKWPTTFCDEALALLYLKINKKGQRLKAKVNFRIELQNKQIRIA